MRLALSAAVLVVASCAPPPAEPSSPPPSVGPPGVEVDEPAGEPGFAVGPASWRSGPDGPLASVSSATVAGGAVVLVGTGPTPHPPGGSGAVAVVDAGSGAVRWSLRAGDRLPGGGGDGYRPGHGTLDAAVDGDVVVVPFSTECQSPNCGDGGALEAGVAGLSAVDGRVLWRAALVEPHELVALAGIGGSVAVVRSANPRVRAAGVDVRTGDVLWQRGDYAPAPARDGVVPVLVAEPGADRGSVGVVDPRTGEPRWSTAAQAPRTAVPVAFGGRLGVLWRQPNGQPGTPNDGTEVVDVRDGSVLADLPGTADHCATGGDVAVCTALVDSGRRLFSYRVGEDRSRLSRRAIPTTAHLITPSGVLLGWTPDGPAHVYDRSANRLGDALPGTPLAVTEEVAVFATPTGVALHPVR